MEDNADTPQGSRRKAKAKKTGNNSIPRVSKTDMHDVFTDYDAVEVFNRVLLKKYEGTHQERSYHLADRSFPEYEPDNQL